MFGVQYGESAVMLSYNSTYTRSITNSLCTPPVPCTLDVMGDYCLQLYTPFPIPQLMHGLGSGLWLGLGLEQFRVRVTVGVCVGVGLVGDMLTGSATLHQGRLKVVTPLSVGVKPSDPSAHTRKPLRPRDAISAAPESRSKCIHYKRMRIRVRDGVG